MNSDNIPQQPECARADLDVAPRGRRAVVRLHDAEQLALLQFAQVLNDLEFDRAEGETRR